MTFVSDGSVELTDPQVLRALAHPVRFAIFDHLQRSDAATATDCAEAVGESPSACSYHLRVLAKHGFVEEVPSDDGRRRPWRVVVSRFHVTRGPEASQEQQAAGLALRHVMLRRDDEIVAEFLRREAAEDPEWRQAATFGGTTLFLTSEELDELRDGYIELLRSYPDRMTDPDKRSAGARPVHVMFRAVPVSTADERFDPGAEDTEIDG